MADRISYGPFTLYESEAYKRGKELEGTKKALEVEEKLLEIQKKKEDLEKSYRESPQGKIAEAEKLGMIQERSRQQQEGIQIGPEIGKAAISAGGPSLLEASRMQGDLLVRQKAEQNRLAAIENILTGGQGIVPTAKVDVGGITQTVPAIGAPEAQADMQSRIYNASWPKFSQMYASQGFAPQEAEKMGKDAAAREIVKNSNSGKISILMPDQSVLSFDIQKAMQMAKDPSTPPAIKSRLIETLGEAEAPRASTWVNKSLGR